MRRRLRLLQGEWVTGIRRIEEDGQPGHVGSDLREQLQLLSDHRRSQKGRARDIPTGPSETGDEPIAHRIANAGHDDRDRPASLPGGKNVLRCWRNDDVNIETYQFGRQGWEPLVLSL